MGWVGRAQAEAKCGTLPGPHLGVSSECAHPPSLVIVLYIFDVGFKPNYKVCFFNVNNTD